MVGKRSCIIMNLMDLVNATESDQVGTKEEINK